MLIFKKDKDNKNLNFFDKDLIEHAKLLFKFCRSLTGEGVRKTLKYFEEYHKEFSRIKVPSGTKVFDWEIPLEWNIKDAYIEHVESGRKYAKFDDSNLHLVGYSYPVNKVINYEELIPRIYTLPDQPNLIPYVTTYYKKDWGFCLSADEKSKLPKGKYKVYIDSTLEKGHLDLSHAYLKGKKNYEIFFSSYVCHPSMLNNELSGPILLAAVLQFLKNKYPKRKYSYRFVLHPETIGSITYLSKFGAQLKKNMICGFNLSCVGDERHYSIVKSPNGNTLADKALSAALFHKSNFLEYTFLERGSDERQYCSPGFRLPLCTFCKTKFGEFPEYHTNADNFDLVTEKGLRDSLDIMKLIINVFENCLYPTYTVKCEPQLGKRNLYKNTSIKTNNEGNQNTKNCRMNLLTYSDGENTLFDISRITNIPLKDLYEEAILLINNGLLFNKD